jgi:hypothetical protein
MSGAASSMIALPFKFKIVILAWLLIWGFLLLTFPVQCHRLLSWGRSPTPRQLKSGRIVGYIALAFGCLFVLELAFAIIR